MKSFDFNLLNVDFSPVNENTKEVLLVIISPESDVLLHEKTFYPRGTFRILSGGVEKDETIQQAAHRELMEELGISAQTEFPIICSVRYFYEGKVHFTTYATMIQLSSIEVSTLRPDTKSEKISELKWSNIKKLPEIIKQLENDLPADLQAWGHFRADQHKAVYNVLYLDTYGN